LERFIFFLLLGYAFFSMISIRIIDITLSAAMVLAIVAGIRNRPHIDFNPVILKTNFLFIAVCILSIFVAGKPMLAANKSWGFLFDMMPLLLCLFFVRERWQIGALLRVLLASFSLVSIYALWQGLQGIPRVAGFFTGHPPQGLAGFFVLLIIYLLILLIKDNHIGARIRILLIPILFIAGTAFLFNGTRGAWLACIIIILLFSGCHLRSHKKALAYVLTGVLMTGLLLVTAPQFETLRNRFYSATNLNMQNRDSERLYKWQMATAVFLDHPLLGVGLDNYLSIPDYDRYLPPAARERQPSNAHNIFFHILAETGILGLFSFLAMFGAILVYCWRKYQADSRQILCLATFYATLGLLLYGQTEYITNDFTVMRLYWLLVGLAWRDSSLPG
jgi:O-antigen ligase